jgi:hypothetical protein
MMVSLKESGSIRTKSVQKRLRKHKENLGKMLEEQQHVPSPLIGEIKKLRSIKCL